MTRFLRFGMVVVVVAAVAVGVQASPASARRRGPRIPRLPKPPVALTIGDQAELSAGSQVANVQITITCRNLNPAPVRVSVRQGGNSGSGRSGSAYKCNGRPQRLLVPVTAGQPFHRGGASASASVALRSANGSSNINASRSLRLI